MRRSDLDYDLPPGRIAQHPAEPRDASRLMVVHRASGRIEHAVFREIGRFLRAGDTLVVNDTRVVPARFFCRRSGAGRVEGLFLHEQDGCWQVLLRPSRRLRPGQVLTCEPAAPTGSRGRPAAGLETPPSQAAPGEGAPVDVGLRLRLVERQAGGLWQVAAEPHVTPWTFLQQVGQTPLPPYIERPGGPDAADAECYQTVYARVPGAVAAPTAGLHFTERLLNELSAAGVRRVASTLHVGPGTFLPIRVDELADHRMHAEWFEITDTALGVLRETRARGGRIVAVGTTVARVLESLDAITADHAPVGRRGWTDRFIYPPYRFRNLDALLTNFHLPGSTLLALVMAFGGVELTRRAYREAIAADYRFYSFGDAMLIL